MYNCVTVVCRLVNFEKVVKSEEPPADNSGPVKVVTAKTFDDIVFSG